MSQEDGLTYRLTYKDVVDILRLLDESAFCEELHLALGDLRLSVVRDTSRLSTGDPPPGAGAGRAEGPEAARAAEASPRAGAAAGVLSMLDEFPGRRPSGIPVTSPLLGTFYRAPSPGAPPFVEVGTAVGKDAPLCIIEVMKLMNVVRAPGGGVIREICVANEAVVERGQVLMLIEPAG